MSFQNDFQASENHVLVIGASGLDIVGRSSTLPEPGTSTPAQVRPSFGGVARNVAENLAKLGLPVSLISVVGQGEFGKHLLDFTKAQGVNISPCLRTAEFNTSSYLAVLTNKGELQFALDDMRAISALKPEYIRKHAELFKQSDFVFIDSNIPAPTLKTVFHQARLAKTPVCADATSNKLASRLIPFLDKIFLLTANAAEAAVLTNTTFANNDRLGALNAARLLINRGVGAAVISIAEFGVCYATSETSGHIPAIKTKIIDPTGAGDALNAALIFGLVNEMPIDEAVRLGVSAASLTLKIRGSVIPDLTLEKIYDQLYI